MPLKLIILQRPLLPRLEQILSSGAIGRWRTCQPCPLGAASSGAAEKLGTAGDTPEGWDRAPWG